MKKLLHIVATPRKDESRTLQIAKEFLKSFKLTHIGWKIDELILFKEKLPELTVKRVDGKYILLQGKDLPKEFQGAWNEVLKQIKRFLSADAYLITAPMWNFNIPYQLKHYIDIIIQPKYLFRYTEKGLEALVKNKKMIIVTSRGGDYGGEAKPYDFQEPYLRAIFGFVGITDITFIHAQPMDALGQDVQKQKLEEAKQLARKVAMSF